VSVAIGVFAQAPIAGACKKRLLAAHPAEWVASLYAAMLRDTLDGLQAIDAVSHTVFAIDDPEALARHVPAPWNVSSPAPDVATALASLAASADVAVVATPDAPTAPTEPLASALIELAGSPKSALLAPTDQGGAFLFAANHAIDARVWKSLPWRTPAFAETLRVRCKELSLPLMEIPPWYTVDAPSDVLRLLDELRKNPERAPRIAQFFVKNA
jgi:glycosyltransferase A (GT-A) superfamily protein (DUF2064 family)